MSPTSSITSSKLGQSEKTTERRDFKKEIEKARQAGMYTLDHVGRATSKMQ